MRPWAGRCSGNGVCHPDVSNWPIAFTNKGGFPCGASASISGFPLPARPRRTSASSSRPSPRAPGGVGYETRGSGLCEGEGSVFARKPSTHRSWPRFFRVTQMARASESFHALVLSGVVLVGGPLLEPLRAQEGLPYPGGSKIAFEWQYSCSNGKNCSFSCRGTGGASHVTKLSIHLGTIPLGDTEKVVGIFYEFSTMEIPRATVTDSVSRPE